MFFPILYAFITWIKLLNIPYNVKYGISIDRKYMCIDRNSCGQGKINIIDGQLEKRVFRIDDEKVSLSSASAINTIFLGC